MNAVSKTGSSTILWRLSLPQISKANMLAMGLVFLTIVSAFSVIYCRDMNRQMTSHLQGLEYQSAKLTLAHNQLLVEQTALSTDQRVASIAESKLNMKIPSQQQVIMVRT